MLPTTWHLVVKGAVNCITPKYGENEDSQICCKMTETFSPRPHFEYLLYSQQLLSQITVSYEKKTQNARFCYHFLLLEHSFISSRNLSISFLSFILSQIDR